MTLRQWIRLCRYFYIFLEHFYEVDLWLIRLRLIAAKCILDGHRWTWDARWDAGRVPGYATGIDTDATGHAAGEGSWEGYDGTIESDDGYVEYSGGG